MEATFYRRAFALNDEIEKAIEEQIEISADGIIRLTDLDFEDVTDWWDWYREHDTEITKCPSISSVFDCLNGLIYGNVLAVKKTDYYYMMFVATQENGGDWYELNDCSNIFDMARLADRLTNNNN